MDNYGYCALVNNTSNNSDMLSNNTLSNDTSSNDTSSSNG